VVYVKGTAIIAFADAAALAVSAITSPYFGDYLLPLTRTVERLSFRRIASRPFSVVFALVESMPAFRRAKVFIAYILPDF